MLLLISAIASFVGLAASLPVAKIIYPKLKLDATAIGYAVNSTALLGVVFGIGFLGNWGFVIGFTSAIGMALSPQISHRLFAKDKGSAHAMPDL